MTIYAAGIVCWREENGKLEVALVHREVYKDWGFPKGKLDPGEQLPQTAVREVFEEAGFKVRLVPAYPPTVMLSGDGEATVLDTTIP